MIYREYSPDNYDELKRLLADLQDFFVKIDSEYRTFAESDTREYLNEIISDARNKDGKIYLAIGGEKVVGFIQGVIIDRKDLQHTPQLEGWVGLLFVEKQYRNQGIGNNLLAKICDYFRSKKCSSVRLFCSSVNKNALKFYERNGFKAANVELKLCLE